MKKYEDKNNDSCVDRYSYEENFFIVELKTGEEVKFEHTSVNGFFPINKLVALAELGEGLDEYMKELDMIAHGKDQ